VDDRGREAALFRGQRLGDELAREGFDWPDARGPRLKIDEELAELDEALAAGDAAHAGRELGDLLFAVVNLARHLGVDADDALGVTIEKVEARFALVERRLAAEGRRPVDCSLDELEEAWQAVKAADR
jgi:nucleoside triphosphate diphosphatase